MGFAFEAELLHRYNAKVAGSKEQCMRLLTSCSSWMVSLTRLLPRLLGTSLGKIEVLASSPTTELLAGCFCISVGDRYLNSAEAAW